MSETYGVRGRVLGEDGQPLAGVRVISGPRSAETDADGRFAFDGFERGTSHSMWAREGDCYTPTININTEEEVELRMRRGATLFARVLADGQPLAGGAFLNDHTSDEDSYLFLPLRAVEDQTISNASIVAANYFFEWCVWLGYAVYCLAFGSWGLIALAPQAIILGSILGVTGIQPTENQAIRSKGDAYREYQRRVSRFIPMPPKSRGNDA